MSARRLKRVGQPWIQCYSSFLSSTGAHGKTSCALSERTPSQALRHGPVNHFWTTWVSDWQTGSSPPLTVSLLPSFFHTSLHSSVYFLTQWGKHLSANLWAKKQHCVNVKSKCVNVCRLIVSKAPYGVHTDTKCLCAYTYCVLIVKLDKHTHPACWVVSWQARSQSKHISQRVSLCAIVKNICFDMRLRLESQDVDTGQKTLFGLS